jgi:peptidoglycan/xylan/chitin deacetylase (PgdA/CDA1 family)
MPALVSFTIDNLGDAADLFRGVISTPRAPGCNPPLDHGYPALLELFARHGIPLTCFVEGWSARQYPDFLHDLRSRGHEVGMHGWQHEPWSELSDAQAEDLAMRATASIRDATGQNPRAFRAPGGKSTPFTTTLLSRLGYDIDASYTDSNAPEMLSATLASIPYQWSGVDATHWLWNSRSGADTEQRWRKALNAAAESDGHYVFIWHPHVMGLKPEWLEAGERTLRFVREDSRFHIVPLHTLRELKFGGTQADKGGE